MNKIEKALSYLTEEIRDIPAEGKNIHYTNLPALISILKGGKLKGSDYIFKTQKAQDGNKSELATIRNTNVNKYGELSGSVDTVKITLYTDRILSGARGVKKEPIAELPQSSKYELEKLERDFADLFDASMPKFKNIRKGFCRNSNSLYPERDKEDVAFVRRWVKEEGLPDDAVRFITVYYKTLARMKEQLANREREERFVVDKEKGIPVKPEFMKIEFVGMPDDAFWESYTPEVKYNKEINKKVYNNCSEAIKTLNDSSPELLIRNKYFQSIIVTLMKNRKQASMLIKNPVD